MTLHLEIFVSPTIAGVYCSSFRTQETTILSLLVQGRLAILRRLYARLAHHLQQRGFELCHLIFRADADAGVHRPRRPDGLIE